MSENPETLNRQIDKQASDGSAASLLRQIEQNKEQQASASALDRIVQLVYNPRQESLQKMETLKDDLQSGRVTGEGARDQIKETVDHDKSALKTQNEVNYYAGTFAKAVPLFAGAKSKAMMATSIGIYGLDAVKGTDSVGEAAGHFALGGAKGFALKATFDKVGSSSFKLGREGSILSHELVGVGLKGVTLGSTSRLYENALSTDTYKDGIGAGISRTLSNTLDGKAMAMDATLFVGAHSAFGAMGKVAARTFEGTNVAQTLGSSAVGKFLSESNMAQNAGMGATFGLASGATGEFMRQKDAGQGYDLSAILKRGALQALTDGAAGATGAGAMQAGRVMRADKAALDANQNTQLDARGRAFAGQDPVSTAGESSASKPVSDNNAAPVSTETTRSYTLDANSKPIFEEGVKLATRAVEPNAVADDVLALFEFGANRSATVRPQLEQVAQQAKDYANVPMERLIKQALETTPESYAHIKDGLELATLASSNKPTSQQSLDLLQFAYGAQGKTAQVPLRMIAEVTGNDAMTHTLQEAYAGANKLTRDNVQPKPLDQYVPPEVKESFRQVMKQPTDTPEGHLAFRDGMHQWLDANPDYHFMARLYGAQTRNGLHAAVIDGKLGTDYLSQFPGQHSVMQADLLQQLGAPSRRGAQVEKPVAETNKQQEQVVEREQTPVQEQAGIRHESGRVIITPEKLFEEFQQSDGISQHSKAHILTEFTGKMSNEQFAEWMRYLYRSAHETGTASPGMHPEINNLATMNIGESSVLMRPEVIDAINNGEAGPIKTSSLHRFLSAPEKVAPGNLSDTELAFIGQRLSLAFERARINPKLDQDGNPLPVDQMQVLKDALPPWYMKNLRETYSRKTDDGHYEYPADFDANLAQWLEAHRAVEMQNPRYKPPREFPNQFRDRLSNLDAVLRNGASNPQLVDQILRLSGNDQSAAKNIAAKLDPTTNAPEHAELLGLVMPHANSIGEVKTLMDAIHFAKKSGENASKARRDGRDTEFHDAGRDTNQAIALSLASRLVPHNDANWPRVERIINDVISGRIRDPRPGDELRPGGFRRNGPGQGRSFEQTGQASRPYSDRPRRDRDQPRNQDQTQANETSQQSPEAAATPPEVVTSSSVKIVNPKVESTQTKVESTNPSVAVDAVSVAKEAIELTNTDKKGGKRDKPKTFNSFEALAEGWRGGDVDASSDMGHNSGKQNRRDKRSQDKRRNREDRDDDWN